MSLRSWKRRNPRSSIKSARRFLAMWNVQETDKGPSVVRWTCSVSGRDSWHDVSPRGKLFNNARPDFALARCCRMMESRKAGWTGGKKSFYVASILGDRYACSMDQFFRPWFISFFPFFFFLKKIYKFSSSRFFLSSPIYYIKYIKRD